ncbi:PQQ-binding-like beta-propeller repeat protein [Schlesneria sp. T3-172]|uniref:outer membrane protein assembly factor BamB family protein n=1 Tax=Schlesneria sphaerica TaxID=3373610 RepID=UPI0037C7FE31
MSDGQLQTFPDTTASPAPSQLRLWPALVILGAWGLTQIWSLVGEPFPLKFFLTMLVSPAVAMVLLLVWWLFASRVRWNDRLQVAGTFVLVAMITVLVAGKNFPALALVLFAVPMVAVLWVGWLLLTYWLPWSVRKTGLILIFVVTGVYFSLLRVDGMDGNFKSTFNWRWIPTQEEKLLTELRSADPTPQNPEPNEAMELKVTDGDWPAFRGPQRDSRLTGTHIRTDWDTAPPKELWRHRIGPGWSSFSVIGSHLFTQEQRGGDELVMCYDTNTGKAIWEHRDATRFEEIVAGPGPRGTPTFHEGRLYAQGANGVLNCLDAATGKLFWSADIVKDSGATVPQWGFSSSPFICRGLVSVFAGGPDGKSVVAYHIENGDLAWTGGEGLQSYSSTQSAVMDEVEQLLISTNAGICALDPDTGKTLWAHHWPVEQARIAQPAILTSTDLLVGTGMSEGTRRLHVQKDGDQWKVSELWTARVFKPYFNDFVVAGDDLYGFDGNIFMCIGLNDGKLKWRARGYGNGQVLLVAEDNLLLILTEQGEVALVEAKPDHHKEVSRFKAIEGKTWNHPVIAHGKLFVRNAEEIACFELTMQDTAPVSPPSAASD